MKGRLVGLLAGILIATGSDAPGRAEPPSVPTLPRAAVGVLEAPHGFCTASVVGPDIILTAAHCLFDERYRPVGSLRFRAGLDRGAAVAEARVTGRFVPSAFDPARYMDSDSLDALDWALLRLDHPVAEQTGMLTVRALDEVEINALSGGGPRSFAQIGYGPGLGRFATVRTDCHVVEWWTDDTFAHDCDSVQGDSGAPSLLKRHDDYVIIGIDTADVEIAGREDTGSDPQAGRKKDANMAIGSAAFARALENFMKP